MPTLDLGRLRLQTLSGWISLVLGPSGDGVEVTIRKQCCVRYVWGRASNWLKVVLVVDHIAGKFEDSGFMYTRAYTIKFAHYVADRKLTCVREEKGVKVRAGGALP